MEGIASSQLGDQTIWKIPICLGACDEAKVFLIQLLEIADYDRRV
jgi:hypothetical protein